jgi:hypothetical protein
MSKITKETTMKRISQVVIFIITTVLLMNLTYPVNVTYAGNNANGPQASPKVTPRYKVKPALKLYPPSLASLASDHEERFVENAYIDNFTITNLESNKVQWSWGWCTKTRKQLEENWANIRIRYYVNGKSPSLENFVTKDETMEMIVDGHGMQKAFCRSSIGLLTDWPAGNHNMRIVVRFLSPLNDGWDIYPRNTTYRTNYKVNVSYPTNVSPVGAKHLGSTDYSCYYINGSNTSELTDQIARFAKENNNMVASAQVIDYIETGGVCYADGSADLSDFNSTIKAQITIPCWYPGPGVKQIEINKFDNYMRKIAKHELRHVEIFEQYNDLYVARIRKVNTCNPSTLRKVRLNVDTLEDKAHTDFHNSPAGAPITYPKYIEPTIDPNVSLNKLDSHIRWIEAKDYVQRIKTVCGPVVNTHAINDDTDKVTFLDLGRSFPAKSRFTVLIGEGDHSGFLSNPSIYFLNKDICVTGFIELHENVAYIYADSAHQISIR